MYLDSRILLSGYWWLPEKESEETAGTLTIGETGSITLELFGSMEPDIVSRFEEGIREYETILGITENGKQITLSKCYRKTISEHFPGFPREIIKSKLALIGHHIPTRADLEFNRIIFSNPDLTEWIKTPATTVRVDLHNKTVDIAFRPVDEESFRIDDNTTLKTEHHYNIPTGANRHIETKITEKVFFSISTNQKKDIFELFNIAHKINNFVSFATCASLPISALALSSNEITVDEDKNKPKRLEFYIESLPNKLTRKKYDEDGVLFNFPSIRGKFEKIIKHWLMRYEEISPCFHLFFSTIHNSLYLDQKFLHLIQGLETLHRRIYGGEQVPEDEYKKKIDAILKLVPEEHLEWLSGKLKYGNEPNLRYRLSDLTKTNYGLIGNSRKIKSFINLTCNTRNYMTHYDKSLENKYARGRKLFSITTKCELIYYVQFLKLIAFDENEIKSIISTSQKIINLKGLCAEIDESL